MITDTKDAYLIQTVAHFPERDLFLSYSSMVDEMMVFPYDADGNVDYGNDVAYLKGASPWGFIENLAALGFSLDGVKIDYPTFIHRF